MFNFYCMLITTLDQSEYSMQIRCKCMPFFNFYFFSSSRKPRNLNEKDYSRQYKPKKNWYKVWCSSFDFEVKIYSHLRCQSRVSRSFSSKTFFDPRSFLSIFQSPFRQFIQFINHLMNNYGKTACENRSGRTVGRMNMNEMAVHPLSHVLWKNIWTNNYIPGKLSFCSRETFHSVNLMKNHDDSWDGIMLH